MGDTLNLEELARAVSTQQALQRGYLVIKPDTIGTRTYLLGEEVYIDITKSMVSDMWIPIAIYPDGNAVPLFMFSQLNGIQVRVAFQKMHPPKNMFTWEELTAAPILDTREVYERVLDFVGEVVKMPSDDMYHLITAYTLYTWLHNLFGKKPNLYVSGMFGTGKSVVGNIVRALGRHPTDLLTSFSSSTIWVLGITRGVLIIDETDRLSATTRMLLRRMHDAGMEVTKMMADELGWQMLSFDISSPVVLIGTHLPEDPALLSRGFIIKMHYGKPRRRLATFGGELRMLRVMVAKAMLLRWRQFLDELNNALRIVEDMEIHERYKDMIAPLIAVCRMCRVDHGWVERVVEYASVASIYQIKTNRAIAFVMRWLDESAPRAMGFIAVTEGEFMNVMREAKQRLGLTDAEFRYVLQYFISSSEPCEVDGEPGFCFVEDDIRGMKRLFFGKLIKVNRRYGGIELDFSGR